MITVTDTDKYYDCISCGDRTKLMTFYIGKNGQIKQGLTICNKCFQELIKQGNSYLSKKEVEK
jgi:uncharacterized CHY-type Zn-finger protein